MSLVLGLVAACACALASACGALLKYRGARQVPPLRLSASSLRTLFANRAFLAGLGLAIVSSLCNALALALAPMTLVKPITAGSLVIMALLSNRMLGLRAGRRQRLGLWLACLGLAGLAITSPGHGGSRAAEALLWFELASILAGLLLTGLAHTRSSAIVMALAAGLLLGADDALVKQLMQGGGLETLLLLVPLALSTIWLTARALQLGEALPTLGTLAVTANLTSIGSGFLVFGEPLPQGALALGVNLAALLAVLAAVTLVPQPAAR